MGNHTIKFGADIRYATNLRIPSDSSRTGILNFDSGDTSLAGSGGMALATMLLGDVSNFQRFVSPPNVQAIGHQWREFILCSRHLARHPEVHHDLRSCAGRFTIQRR